MWTHRRIRLKYYCQYGSVTIAVGSLEPVRVSRNARKHGIDADAIRRVLESPLRSVRQGDAVLHIGLGPRRDLLEVVVAPGDPSELGPIVVHAMRLRPANYRYLTPQLPDTPHPDTAAT